MKVGVIAIAVNIALSLALFIPLKHVGLAFATSIAAFVNAGLLYRGLRKEKVFLPHQDWGVFFGKITACSAAMGFAIAWLMVDPGEWLVMPIWQRVLQLSGLIFAGGVVYIVSLFLLGVNLKSLWQSKGGA